MSAVDILLATCNRRESLILTLAGIAAQTFRDVRVIVADQSHEPVEDAPGIAAARAVIEVHGGSVEWHYRLPRWGIAEQRDFLLRRARAAAVLYLDDDVFMEPSVVERLLGVLREQDCGFVGAFPVGLSHRDDVRPEQQVLEPWDGPVRPEAVEPGSREWERWQLHRAANLHHASRHIPPGRICRYKVAWIASCILYDRARLLEVGGFRFWPRLTRWHSGEEVLAQNLLMRRWGGCGITPSGTYYTEVPTTVLNGAGTVDSHALDLLDEMIERYVLPEGVSVGSR